MKILFRLTFLLVVFPLAALAQTTAQQKGTQPSQPTRSTGTDCFKEWYTLFQERGAKTVPDGTHDVILTMRNTTDGTSACYMGRVEVAGGKIKPPFMVQKEDGTYDTFGHLSGKRLDPAFEKSLTEDELLAIHNGMSINMKTADLEYGRIFFYQFLNEKPKALKKAPSPKALIKN